MPSTLLQEFRVSIVAGIVVDKLELAKNDAWTLAAHSSNQQSRSLWSSVLWSMPLLGSSQLMLKNFPMGEPRAYGVIVGDGQEVSAINPLLTEWLFNNRTIPTGTCIFGTLTYEGSTRGWQGFEDLAILFRRHSIFALAGLPLTILVLVILGFISSISYFSPMFIAILYVATAISNFYLTSQSQNSWAGFTGDTEKVQILILAPGDRWATLSGPRNLIKLVTTGSHIDQHPSSIKNAGQYMLVAVLLSTGFLQSATLLDGIYICCSLGIFTAAAWTRAERFGQNPRIRGVNISYNRQKTYTRRANLVEELSASGKSDAWAYDSNLLTRRFVSETSRTLTNYD